MLSKGFKSLVFPVLVWSALLYPNAFSQYLSLHVRPVSEASGSYPVPGSHLLWKEEAALRQYVDHHPESMIKPGLKKSSWGFSVGSPHQWYAHDFVTGNEYLVQSTCRGVGSHCYVFVEDSLWNNRVSQANVDSILSAFDSSSPADPHNGIYQMDVDAFGNPPDVDSDPKIVILVLNIVDGWNGVGGYVEGYFYSRNELNVSQSNKGEIYFIDANPVDLSSSAGLRSAMSTTAHEFQHMIHWNYDRNEISFVNEGCSLLAEVNCGYPIYNQSYFSRETNHYLFDWRSNDNVAVLNDYSRAARFAVYIRDQLGIGVFKQIVASTLHGIEGLNDAFSKFGTMLRFDDLFGTWTIANILNDRSLNQAYGYVYPNLPLVSGPNFFNPNVINTTDTIANLGSRYLIYKGGLNLSITFNTTSSKILIKAIRRSKSGVSLVDIVPGTEFNEPGYGTTYNEIDFVIINTDYLNPQVISFSSRGNSAIAELKWDQSEPVGYFGSSALSLNDTICVTFDPVPGGKLDSVRVALRRAGVITGGVYAYTGTVRPTPLGKPLAVPISASISTTSPFPYPVPYANWSNVNLTAYSINTDNPFAVAFVIGQDPSTPGVMVSYYPGSSDYHSYTYLNSSSNWYYITKNSDTIYVYLVRAYVSFSPTGLRQVVELKPSQFRLMQNYPNPFNPSTKISFDVARHSHVKLIVYDVLGREIRVLVNEKKDPGRYEVDFNAGALPGGVYLYRLMTESFSEVKKLIVIR
ncbi:MAG: T9SS type A sorting domain-containing protein [Candidatus Kryptoniota bacterium]